MHFFRRISVKNIDAIQYINDWVKGLRICSSCAIATRTYTWYWVKGLQICHACARTNRGRYVGGTAGGIMDTAGGSEYL